MVELPYPHRRNDCSSCREYDADMTAQYPTLQGSPMRLCQRCVAAVLTHMVVAGHTVTVEATDPDLAAGVAGERGQHAASAGGDPVILGVGWTVDLAEQVLRTALPTGREFLRVLVDEGGTATAECLKQRIGRDQLNSLLAAQPRHTAGQPGAT